MGDDARRATWTFLSNHARVLIAVAREPTLRVRDISSQTGVTERTAQTILADLEDAGFVDKRREGRRNTYRVHPDLAFRHPLESGHDVGELLGLFVQERGTTGAHEPPSP